MNLALGEFLHFFSCADKVAENKISVPKIIFMFFLSKIIKFLNAKNKSAIVEFYK